MWDKLFPTIEGAEDLPYAVGRYWDMYYKTAEQLAESHPDNVRIVELDRINSAEGQAEVLRFCGVDDPEPGAFHSNIGRPRRV